MLKCVVFKSTLARCVIVGLFIITRVGWSSTLSVFVVCMCGRDIRVSALITLTFPLKVHRLITRLSSSS